MKKAKKKPGPHGVRAFTDGNAPQPATMAVDAQPRAGDPTPTQTFADVGSSFAEGIASGIRKAPARYLTQSGYGFRPVRPGDEGRPVYIEHEEDE